MYAFTYEGGNQHTASRELVRQPIIEFARRGIAGLKSQDSVRLYRKAWMHAMKNDGADDIQPGDLVVLPTIDFPPMRTGTDGYDSEEGAQRTLERIKAKHGPKIIAKQAQDPKVAREVAEDREATKQVIRQQSARTHRLIQKRKEAIQAAGPGVKGQMASLTSAGPGLGAMDNTPGYRRVNGHQGEMIGAWMDCIKAQSFVPYDMRLLLADQAALECHVAERRVFVEAISEGADPYEALRIHRKETSEQFQREIDEAEAETDLDAGLEELEKFANEG